MGLSDELKLKYGEVDEGLYKNAYEVIRDYAQTGGKNTEGGTGLKKTGFDALYEEILSSDEIQGSGKSYSPQEVIGLIDQVRKGKIELSYITRSGGLREKVSALLAEEKKNNTAQNAEKAELPHKSKSIEKFISFWKRNEAQINSMEDNKSLEKFIYSYFYSKQEGALKYREDDPRTEELKGIYSNKMAELNTYINNQSKKDELVRPINTKYWTACNINKTISANEAILRTYFNVKPEYAAGFFATTLRELRVEDINAQIKMPTHATTEAFNRQDKMVMYFNSGQEKKTLAVIEKLYNQYPFIFEDNGTPPFVAEAKNSEGNIMNGIGYAQDPMKKGESFGTTRCKALAEVVNNAKEYGFSASDKEFDFSYHFKEACIKYNIDPENPAFNLDTDKSKLAEIKKRAA